MWEIREQIKRLLESTYMPLQELSELISAEGFAVSPSEISRAMKDEPPTAKQHRILMEAHGVLTGRLEEMNARKARAIRRAEKAMTEAESLNSTGR